MNGNGPVDESGAVGYAAPLKNPVEPLLRSLLQRKGMTARGLGILSYLISMPPGWKTGADRLSRHFEEGRDAIETALSGLEVHGLIAGIGRDQNCLPGLRGEAVGQNLRTPLTQGIPRELRATQTQLLPDAQGVRVQVQH